MSLERVATLKREIEALKLEVEQEEKSLAEIEAKIREFYETGNQHPDLDTSKRFVNRKAQRDIIRLVNVEIRRRTRELQDLTAEEKDEAIASGKAHSFAGHFYYTAKEILTKELFDEICQQADAKLQEELETLRNERALEEINEKEE